MVETEPGRKPPCVLWRNVRLTGETAENNQRRTQRVSVWEVQFIKTGTSNPLKRQLDEARAEWKRRKQEANQTHEGFGPVAYPFGCRRLFPNPSAMRTFYRLIVSSALL